MFDLFGSKKKKLEECIFRLADGIDNPLFGRGVADVINNENDMQLLKELYDQIKQFLYEVTIVEKAAGMYAEGKARHLILGIQIFESMLKSKIEK